jgi:hypothetical protein
MFAAALGLASSAIGAIGASSAAKNQAKAAMYQAQKADEANKRSFALAQQQMGFAQQAMARENQLYDYTLSQNELAQRLAQDQQRYERDFISGNQDTALDQFQMGADRLNSADSLAYAERMRQLSELANNQNLSAQERQFAVQQLQQAQQLAAGERNFDIDRLRQDQAQLQAEQQWMRERYGEQVGQAQSERQYDIDQRAMMLSKTDQLSQLMAQAYAAMGDPVKAEVLGRGDVDSEITRRTGEYMADADRAATLVASQNEAGLIRNGMDNSTQATARRGDVAARISAEYRNARTRASDDAIKYITGVQGQLNVAQDLDTQLRNATLTNLMTVHGAPMQYALQAGNMGVGSAANAMSNFSGINSAVSNREVGSAGNYNTPVAINSAVYTSPVSSGYSDMNLPQMQFFGPSGSPGSAPWQMPQVSSPSSYLSGASSLMAGIAGNAQTAANSANANASNAASAAGSAWADLVNKQIMPAANSLDAWWKGRKTSNPYVSYSDDGY